MMKKQTNKQNDAVARTALIHWKKNRRAKTKAAGNGSRIWQR